MSPKLKLGGRCIREIIMGVLLFCTLVPAVANAQIRPQSSIQRVDAEVLQSSRTYPESVSDHVVVGSVAGAVLAFVGATVAVVAYPHRAPDGSKQGYPRETVIVVGLGAAAGAVLGFIVGEVRR